MGLSDFPWPFVIGLPLSGFRCGPARRFFPWPVMGSPGSRTRCLSACTGSPTARGSHASCDSDASGVAFRSRPRRRHPEVYVPFRGSIPGLHLPLSTLRTHSYPCLRMTRGCCDSLCLQHMELSSTTPCRFVPAHGRWYIKNIKPVGPSLPNQVLSSRLPIDRSGSSTGGQNCFNSNRHDMLVFIFRKTEILRVIDVIRPNFPIHCAGNQHIPTVPTLLEYAPRYCTTPTRGIRAK